MLAVTGGGRARRFEDVRDHAIIRVFTEGARLTELSQIQMSDLSHDLIAQPFIRVIPLKGARASDLGRLITGPASSAAGLRARGAG